MKNSTILIVVGVEVAMPDLARQLEAIRAVPARAVIALVGDIPQFPYYALGVPPYGGTGIPREWEESVAQSNAALKAKQDDIEALLGDHDVTGDVVVIASEPARISEAVGRHAMLCDIAMVNNDLRGSADTLFRPAVHGVLFQSPIGVVLNDPAARVLQHSDKVLVAWNTHLHTARAVHQALPLLRQAKEVVIGCVDPVMTEYQDGEDPGVDVAKWLTHHGCTVTVQNYPSGGQDVGRCILTRAKESGADLIVMGSYSHSRTRETIFGGTTRTLIEQTDVPVFLGH